MHFIHAQTATASQSGYVGYGLGVTGDGTSASYQTDETNTDNSTATAGPPDVYLNASVHVGAIDIVVENLTAKVNLDAQVLSLLSFNAGVDVSIKSVDLSIKNVTAKVLLEARLENLVTMIDDVLDSIDLNPVIASLGSDLGQITNSVGSLVDDTVGGLTGSNSSGLSGRSYDLSENILYSMNDYSGNTHTNRILEQDGSIVDQNLDNHGRVHGQKVVGSYAQDMTYSGHEQATTVNGQPVQGKEYFYNPYLGLNVISIIYTGATGDVVAARVISESSAGGSSTIGESQD